MSDAFRQSLDALLVHGLEDVAEVIEVEETHFYADRARLFGDVDEDEFVGAPPPGALMAEPVATVADLRSLIRAIDDRWRLDALAALDDYLS